LSTIKQGEEACREELCARIREEPFKPGGGLNHKPF